MKSLLASVRAGNGLDCVDHAVQLLEDEWRKHEDVPLERLWADQRRSIESDADEPVIMLAELIRTDLRCRFARGQTPTVSGYLDRFPELNAADSRVLSLIYEEFCLKEERGDPVDVESFCDRYPRWKESLVSQLQYHHLFSQAAGLRPKTPQFPQPGDTFEEFQLVSLLGRGGTARVFLARDLSLGGKQVVLKVSMDRGREPQAQGALDHPHIVPVNSVVFDDREMRGLSMPYRPGLPLDEVIRRVAPAARPRRAMALWEALIRPPEGPSEDSPETMSTRLADLRTPTPRGDGWEGFPVRDSYAQGVAWMVKVIADALHYAHGERTFHRDVKPANVLLTLQHGPQLLDFNLAESPHSASQAQAAMHGGTLPYMAPEQIEAFLNPELWGKVGAQADVYSLGLVLRELLSGQAPDLPAETLSPPRAMRVLLDRRPLLDVSVRRTNPAIPHALEAIAGKCLTVSPEDRYPDAGALVEDLERFLQHRPLVHAKNPSYPERCTNWGVRNRLRLAVGAACLAPFFLVLGLMLGGAKTPAPPSTPILDSPALWEAMNRIDDGDPRKALATLETLAGLYPRSSLPRLGLCLAYDALEQDQAAQSRFREALDMPNARQEVSAFGIKYPRLIATLGKFAKVNNDRGFKLSRRSDLDKNGRRQESKETFELSRAAAELALEIKGAPPLTHTDERLLAPEIDEALDQSDFSIALSDEGLGDYEAEYARASRALESIESPRPNGSVADDYPLMKKRERTRFDWSWLRCRVATRLAARLREEKSGAARESALRYMVVAEKDLRSCRRFLDNFANSAKDRRWVEGVRGEAMLTYGELDIDLDHLHDAANHLVLARKAITTFTELTRQLYPPDDARYESQVKVLESRLNEAFALLERRKQEAGSAKAATRVTDAAEAEGPHKGR